MIGKKDNEAADKWQGISEDEQIVRQKITQRQLKMAEMAAAKATEESSMLPNTLQVPAESNLERSSDRSWSQGSASPKGRKEPENTIKQEAIIKGNLASQQSTNASVKFKIAKGSGS